MGSLTIHTQPILSTLDADHVIQFAENFKKTPLSNKEKEEIKKAFASHDSLAQTAEVTASFVSIQQGLQLLPGLTNPQIETLRNLVQERKKFKDAHIQGELEIEASKHFIANERQILPFDKMIERWMTNTAQLNSEEIWHKIATLTRHSNKKQGEGIDETEKRIELLTVIKNDWAKHNAFAGYSSENLLLFYNDYIKVLKEYLTTVINAKHNYTPVILPYLEKILTELKQIELQAIHSMLFRLYTAEHYQDIECDDLIAYTCNKIEKACNIHIQDIKEAEKLRKSLHPELAIKFIEILKSFNSQSEEKLNFPNIDAIKEINTPIEFQHALLTAFMKKNEDNFLKLNQYDCKISNKIFDQTHLHYFSDKKIDEYLAFIDKYLLVPIRNAICDNKTTLDVGALSSIFNMLSHLTSDHLKLLLINTHKNAVEDNPYWLTLINHLDDKKTIHKIELTNYHNDYFNNLLLFSKHITEIKHQTKKMLKSYLLTEAGIPFREEEAENISSVLQGKGAKSKKLLKLLSLCLEKLNKEEAHSTEQIPYTHFYLDFIAKISYELFLRARTDHALIAKLLDKLIIIDKIKASEEATQSLSSISNKASVLQLMFNLEENALHKISKEKLPSFRRACNDKSFTDIEKIKQTFKIKRDMDAIKLMDIMKIYHQLLATFGNKKLMDNILNDPDRPEEKMMSRIYSVLTSTHSH